MTHKTMTPEHPLWKEFTDRLAGPEGCNFRKNRKGEYQWTCHSTYDLTIAIFENMRGIHGDDMLDLEQSLTYFGNNGGYCDCEILFNVEERWERSRQA